MDALHRSHLFPGYDVLSYQDQLRTKLAQLYDFVELNNAQASSQQKLHFDRVTQARTFVVGDLVWLSITTAGKLDPKWEKGWTVQSVQSPITYSTQLMMGEELEQ